MNVDDLKDLPEPSRTRAKALLTCKVCNKYFDDPRVLPCRHSFCRKCLEKVHDELQASIKPPSRRVGSMPCPTCRQPIGIPLTGIHGFPVDTKVARIKELVIAEIHKNLSKKMSGDTGKDSQKKSKSDGTSSGKAEKNEKNSSEEEGKKSDDFKSFSEKAGTGVGYKRNSAYPDFSKFARYFDADGKPAESRPYKPTIKVDRQRLGYSNSFQHGRRKVPLRTKAFDDTAADLFLSSGGGGYDSDSLDTGSADTNMEDNKSKYQRSRSARPSTSRRYMATDDIEFDQGGESTEGEGDIFRRREESPPASKRPSFSRETQGAEGKGGDENVFDSVLNEGGGGARERPKPRRSLHTEAEGGTGAAEAVGGRRGSRSSRTKASTLPTHRENVTTEEKYFGSSADEKREKSREKKNKPGVHFSEDLPFSERKTETRSNFEIPKFRSSEETKERVSKPEERKSSGVTDELRSNRRKVDFADEKQAPSSASSYTSERRRHDVVNQEEPVAENVKEPEKPKRNKPVFDMPPIRTPETKKDERNKSSKDENKKSCGPKSPKKEDRKERKVEKGKEEGASMPAEDSEKKPDEADGLLAEHANRRRANRPERLQRKDAERRTDQMPADFGFPAPNRDVPYRSKEQKRQDARRNFSNRIKEVFDDYKKNYAEPEATPETDKSAESTPEKDLENKGKENKKEEPAEDAEKKKEEDVDDKPGRNWEELINNARAKYSGEDVEKIPPPRDEPECGDNVYPRWRLQKAEYGIPTCMAISSKGCVVVAEYGLGCVEFYDENGELAHSMEGVKPFSLAINDKDHICTYGILVIVGDRKGKAVRIFDEYGCDVSHWDATTFNWICGIAVLPNTPGHLVVYDRERCKLGLYAPPGELVREFQSSYGSSDSQLCMADFITVDSHGRVLVADSSNHCIKVFDSSTGSFLKKFGSRGDGDGCLDWPKGICVDSSDNIIVSDVHNKRVSMFSSDGRFMQHLVTGITNPYSVCYSDVIKAIGITQYSQDGTSQYDLYGLQ